MPFIAKFQILNPIISALHIVYYLIFMGGGRGETKDFKDNLDFMETFNLIPTKSNVNPFLHLF